MLKWDKLWEMYDLYTIKTYLLQIEFMTELIKIVLWRMYLRKTYLWLLLLRQSPVLSLKWGACVS